MRKVKTLYEFENHKLVKHSIEPGCSLLTVGEHPEGTRYRCLGHNGLYKHDFYGWGSLKAAKKAAIQDTKIEIIRAQEFLKKLTRETPRP